MEKHIKLANKINQAYKYYCQNNDLKPLIETIYKEFYKYLLYINPKEEYVENFIIEFLESQLLDVLKYYKIHKKEVEFSRYLRKAIKFAYLGYLKKQKGLKFNQLYVYDSEKTFNYIYEEDPYFYNNYLNEENFWFIILESLKKLNIEERIIFKLYYDFKLDSEELNYLVKKYGFKKIKEFLNHYEEKKEKINNKNQQTLNNANSFYYKNILDSQNNHEILPEYKWFRYNFYRRRISKKTIPSAKIIADFIGITKSQLYGYIYKIKNKILKILNNKIISYQIYHCA
jgi:hypothetical protein